jgi:LysM repeat protein
MNISISKSGFFLLLFLGAVNAQDVKLPDMRADQTIDTTPADATHVVKKGDTLWDLAFQFLGDPFKWPLIWQLNTYIKNPDLIYPGNILKIPGENNINLSGLENSTPIQSETKGALAMVVALRDSSTHSSSYGNDSLILSSLRQRSLLSPAYFASAPFLWTQKDARGNRYPGNGTVKKPTDREAYQRFDILNIELFKDVSYEKNDTIDIYTSIKFFHYKNAPANLVKRTGRACVREVNEKTMRAQLIDMWDVIKGDERIAPALSFEPLEIDTITEPDISFEAEVFTRAEETESPYPFQTVILDRGKEDGVKIGDIFALYHRIENGSPQFSMVGYIVNVTQNSSSMSIMSIAINRVSEGDRAILIKRSVFSIKDKWE